MHPGRLVAVFVVVGLVFVAMLGAVRWLSREGDQFSVLARLPLSEEPAQVTLTAPASGRLSFWTLLVYEESVSTRKHDALRYEIEVTVGGRALERKSCNPFSSTLGLRDERSGSRHTREQDMDGCELGVPAGQPLVVRARRVLRDREPAFTLLTTELIVRP